MLFIKPVLRVIFITHHFWFKLKHHRAKWRNPMLRNSENPLSINKLTLSALFCLMVPHELNTDQDTVYCEQDIKIWGSRATNLYLWLLSLQYSVMTGWALSWGLSSVCLSICSHVDRTWGHDVSWQRFLIFKAALSCIFWIKTESNDSL